MAIYICSRCLFCFERASEVYACPDCGHHNIRYADINEQEEYRINKAASDDNYAKTYTIPCDSKLIPDCERNQPQ